MSSVAPALQADCLPLSRWEAISLGARSRDPGAGRVTQEKLLNAPLTATFHIMLLKVLCVSVL